MAVLSHGETDDRQFYGDPVAAARKWIGQGAKWIDLADLDAATLAAALRTGCQPVVIGAAACGDMDWVEKAIAVTTSTSLSRLRLTTRRSSHLDQVLMGTTSSLSWPTLCPKCATYVVTGVDSTGAATSHSRTGGVSCRSPA